MVTSGFINVHMCIYVYHVYMHVCPHAYEDVFSHAHMQRSQRSTLGMFLCCFCGRGFLAWLDSESWGPTYCHSSPSTMQRCTAILDFHVGAGDLYSYSHTHTRSTLPPGLSPPSLSSSFRLRMFQILNF